MFNAELASRNVNWALSKDPVTEAATTQAHREFHDVLDLIERESKLGLRHVNLEAPESIVQDALYTSHMTPEDREQRYRAADAYLSHMAGMLRGRQFVVIPEYIGIGEEYIKVLEIYW